MKKIDKIKNIQKANLIAEQLYLKNKGVVNEISADLKRRAFNAANDKFNNADYDTDGLNKRKYAQQADKFLSHVNPEIEKFIKDRAAAFNLKVGVEKKIESYHDTEVIYLYFLPSTDTSTGSYAPNYSNNLFSVGIMKNNYKLNKDNSVEIPKNFDRALLQIIKVIQEKEISNETKGSVEI